MVRQLQGHDLHEYDYASSGIQKHYSPQIRMRAVDQKLKINLVWPYGIHFLICAAGPLLYVAH